MIRSMTGFGRGESQAAGYGFLVEIKSVNHRFFNASFRLPREFAQLESALARRCSEDCERGHLDVRIEVRRPGDVDGRVPRLNRAALDSVMEFVAGLEALPGVAGNVDAGTLLGLPGVIDWEPEPVALEVGEFMAGVGAALDAALAALVASRSLEGQTLDADLRKRLAVIERWRSQAAERAPERELQERERLHEKVSAVLGDRSPELDQRIAQEVVLLADRVDVSEELSRMRAHLDHFEVELDSGSGGAVGRKLTFLLQELGREANTLAAKANDVAMQQAAIEIKSELEKMREQAENVE